LYRYKDRILGEREFVFLLHSDICCTFPLIQLLEAHKNQTQARMTMMGTTVSAFLFSIADVKVDSAISKAYGCYVSGRTCLVFVLNLTDPNTNQMLHYAEHPDSYISNTINGGAYVLSASVLLRPIHRTPSKLDLFQMAG
jgi:mannose-1-phosphate guanylyltransferase